MRLPQPICVIQEKHQAQVLLQGDRIQYLKLLSEPGSASSLAQQVGTPRQKVNYHLRALEEAGLIHLVGTRKARNCTERILQATAIQYVLSPEVLADLANSPTSDQNRFSSAYLINMAAKTIRELGTLRQLAQQAEKKIATMSLETELSFATAKDRSAFAQELTEMLSHLLAKYHRPESEEGREFRLFFGLHPKFNPRSKDEGAFHD